MAVTVSMIVKRTSTQQGSALGKDGNYHPVTEQVLELVPSNPTNDPDLVDARMTIVGSTAAMIKMGYMSDAQTLVVELEDFQEVELAAPNSDPIANAGPDQAVSTTDPVTLDGSDSTDPDGDTLEYSWTQISGTSVVLTGANTDSPTFTAPGSADSLVFQLEVRDGNGGQSIDFVTVEVT